VHVVENYEGDEVKILKLRNPWGAIEWKGEWSDHDTVNWTPKLKEQLGWEDKDDGCFYMEYDDFYENFASTCMSSNAENGEPNLVYLDMHKYQKPVAFFEFDVTKEILIRSHE